MMATPRLHVSLNIFVMAKYPKYPCKGQAQTRTTFELERLTSNWPYFISRSSAEWKYPSAPSGYLSTKNCYNFLNSRLQYCVPASLMKSFRLSPLDRKPFNLVENGVVFNSLLWESWERKQNTSLPQHSHPQRLKVRGHSTFWQSQLFLILN